MNPATYQISPQIQQQIDLMNQMQQQQAQPQASQDQGKLQYLYNLAQMNPQNSGLAQQYLNAYMAYKYPQPDPMQELFQQMGYQTGPGAQQGAGQQYGGMPGQNNSFAGPGGNGAQTPQRQPNSNQLVIDVPDQQQQSQAQPNMDKMFGQGVSAGVNTLTNPIGAFGDLFKSNYMSPSNVGGQQVNPSLQNSYNSTNGYASQFNQFNNPPRY